jgi:predicted nuclease with TOPRIM domain
MAISDEDIKELEQKEKELEVLNSKIQMMQKESSKLNQQFEDIRNVLREKYGIAPYDVATLSSQFKLLRKALKK